MSKEEEVIEEVVTQASLTDTEPQGAGSISGRGFAKAAAKGILSGLNPLNTLKLLDGVARGEIEPKDAAKMLNPVGPITDAAKAIRQGRIDEGKDVIGGGRIKNFFSRDDGEDMAFGPGGKRVKKNKGSLVGNQSLLDKNNDGKISGEDFKMLREKKVIGGFSKLGNLVSKSLLKNPKTAKAIPKDKLEEAVEEGMMDETLLLDFGVPSAKLEVIGFVTGDVVNYGEELKKIVSKVSKVPSKYTGDNINKVIPKKFLKELSFKQFVRERSKGGEVGDTKTLREMYRLYLEARNKLNLKPDGSVGKYKEELDPRYEEFGISKEDLEPLTEAQKRRNAEEMERIKKQGIPFNKGGRVEYQEGSLMVPPEMESDMPVDTYPNIPPEEMAAAEASQLPDAEMEDKYMDFVLDESLDDEEQSYLMNALEDDPKLSQIFDKVIMTASEFTGAGEVEGPGTGVSDSIPARLSDGEFVFTKKATDQIGADNLQMMMDDAERAFDGGMMREPKRMGGMMMEDEDPDLMEAMSNEDINRQMLMSNRAPSLLGTN
tara:strand:- start:1366 stop:2997 length:1632 start_codon:yes stop_codon:yes gene_type:complete